MCDNAPNYNKIQDQFARVTIKPYRLDQIAHTMNISDAHSTHPPLSLRSIHIAFIWMIGCLALYGYICLSRRACASCDVVEPSYIDRNVIYVKIWTPDQSLQSHSVHLLPTHITYTHHASTAIRFCFAQSLNLINFANWSVHKMVFQSIQTRIKALYEPIIQYQGSTYIQSLGSVVAALFGGFVSKSHTFKLFLFLSFNLPVSVHAQYTNCTGYRQCYHETITCDHGNAAVNCTIDCIGEYACDFADIYGGAGPLFINCHGYLACSKADIRTRASTLIDGQGLSSLSNADIHCNTTEYCNITAEGWMALYWADIYADIVSGTKLFVNATGESALQDTIIRCPIDDIRGDSYSNDALCNIYAQGDEVMKGTKIYAVESFYNAHIECDAPQTTISNPNVYNSVLLCAEFEFDQFCELECPQNGIGIEFVDESNCFCADYMIPTPQPTHNPTMLPTTSSPTFSPTKYDPKEESPNVLYVSKNGCDAGPCDSDRYVDEPHCLKDQTNVISSKCTSNNTLLFNVTGVVTVTHSVTEDAYDYCPTHPHCSDDYVRNEGVEVLCFGIDDGQCYRPAVMEVLYQNIDYRNESKYLNIGYRNESNLLNNKTCYSGTEWTCDEFIECPVRITPLDTVWSADAGPYALYITNGPGVNKYCFFPPNPPLRMNVKLSLQCGQPCQSVEYTWSCLNGSEFDCSQYDGNGKIKMDVGQYTFNGTMRISNKQIRIDGQSSNTTTLTHRTGTNIRLIDCYFRQCYLTLSNLSYSVTSSTSNIIKASNGGNIEFQNVIFINEEENTTLSFIFEHEANVLFTNCVFEDQCITWT
eukprot:1027285_1